MRYTFVSHANSAVPSKIMKDFLSTSVIPTEFGQPILSEDDIRSLATAKGASYTAQIRNLVADALEAQNIEPTSQQKNQLKALRQGALTVTTGHQLMVCGGTAFFEVKILSAVALAKRASELLQKPVVPIFWMASEDHDYEEIASFSVNGQRFTWESKVQGGAVGRIPTKGLAEQLNRFLAGASLTEVQRKFLTKRCEIYAESENLSQATREIVKQWCGEMGVLIIDGDDPTLKAAAGPIWDLEMQGKLGALVKQRTNELKENGIKAQVFPRDINLFVLGEGYRERLMQSKELAPECISPNALMRPVYQEYLLPNIAYVGGGGELAYWLQLGSVFEHLNMPMPGLYLRDSLVVAPLKTERLMTKLQLKWPDLLGTTKESLLKAILEYQNLKEIETARLAGPLLEAVENWEVEFKVSYPELSQHAEATAVKMRKLAQRTVEQRYRVQKQRKQEEVSSLNQLYDWIAPQGVFWERKASYADVLGLLGHDPKDELVEKMSTIKAGTHVLLG